MLSCATTCCACRSSGARTRSSGTMASCARQNPGAKSYSPVVRLAALARLWAPKVAFRAQGSLRSPKLGYRARCARPSGATARCARQNPGAEVVSKSRAPSEFSLLTNGYSTPGSYSAWSLLASTVQTKKLNF